MTETGVPPVEVLKEKCRAQAAREKSAPRACATAPALRLLCGALHPLLGSVPPRHPACGAAPSFRLRPGLLGTCRRGSAAGSPPVGLSHRLLASA